MLSSEQIAYLFTFCEKHLVYFYEVQVELVDHLANAIELEMEHNPSLTFEDALEKVYSGFGIMGFAPVVREKANQMQRAARKAYWYLFRKEFGWPQVLRFLCAVAAVYSISVWSQNAGLIAVAAIVLGGTISGIRDVLRLSRLQKRSGKKFMALQTNYHSSISWLPLYFYSNAFVQSIAEGGLYSVHPMVLGVLAGFSITGFVASSRLSTTLKDRLKTDHPEVFELA